MKTRLGKKQKGAAAIEFALVFVIFFAVLYGVVSYSFPLLLMQSFNNATAEAVRRGMAVDPNASGYEVALKKEVGDVLAKKLQWVPTAVRPGLLMEPKYENGILSATVTLQTDYLKSIMPVLKLGAIKVPDLPAQLQAVSSVQLANK